MPFGDIVAIKGAGFFLKNLHIRPKDLARTSAVCSAGQSPPVKTNILTLYRLIRTFSDSLRRIPLSLVNTTNDLLPTNGNHFSSGAS